VTSEIPWGTSFRTLPHLHLKLPGHAMMRPVAGVRPMLPRHRYSHLAPAHSGTVRRDSSCLRQDRPQPQLQVWSLRSILAAMAKKPKPPQPTSWYLYKVAAKQTRLGEVEAADEAEAIEKAAKEFRQHATKLIAVRRQYAGSGHRDRPGCREAARRPQVTRASNGSGISVLSPYQLSARR
jgi:hypothetical protein